LKIRLAHTEDIPALLKILNEIIKIGGTTAFQEPLTDSEFSEYFVSGANCQCCFLCEDDRDAALGFQALSVAARLPDDWGDIATFARVSNKVKGVGSILFSSTLTFATEAKLNAINATIRADNIQGLSYYEKLGFVDYDIARAVPLKDGTPVDRISKKYVI